MFERSPAKPILTAADWPYPVNAVFNPGAVRLPDGETLLLCRVETKDGLSHLTAARSSDGISNWKIDPVPTFASDAESPYEAWGVEDCRITPIDDGQRYAICYTAYSPVGPAVALAVTSDFNSFDRLGVALPPENKDAALFSRQFDGRYAMLHRPVTSNWGAYIWISYSSDLRAWGEHRVVLEAGDLGSWESSKIGLCGPPIETGEGWIILYHGVRQTASGSIYRVGAALLDLENPSRAIGRCPSWVLSPETDYERTGDVPNVVFPSGHVMSEDGEELVIYYGAADTCIARARASTSKLLALLRSR